ncbi:MAG: ammonia-forming cytochrome c nitrite reductase subunit c552, partial [Thermoplasmata archaeon]
MSLPDPSNSIDFDSMVCGECHRTTEFDSQSKTYHPYYDEWNISKHSLSLSAADGDVVTNPDCQGCHVAQVIIYETFEGGSISRPIQDPQPIVCAVCHDPHGSPYENQLRKPKEELCSTCHTVGTVLPGEVIRHPQSSMRTGVSGIDESEVPKLEFMRDALCSDCHMYSTGPPQNITGHSFRPRVEACVSCHESDPRTFPITLDEASSAVGAWQSLTIDTLLSTEHNLTKAEEAIENAYQYHFSDEVLNSAQELYDTANYSMNFVIADRSHGAHNPPYALALLSFANETANEVIDMLTPGTVTGRIVDENGEPVQDARIQSLGKQLAVTGNDGNFTFDLAPGTYTFSVLKEGTSVATIENVEVSGGETTELGEISSKPPQKGIDPLILAIVIILVLALVFAIVYILKLRFAKKKE